MDFDAGQRRFTGENAHISPFALPRRVTATTAALTRLRCFLMMILIGTLDNTSVNTAGSLFRCFPCHFSSVDANARGMLFRK